MNYFTQRKQYLVILGCLLLSFVMGSIHAFSLLLEPIETKFDVPRTFSSFTYSISLISITTAVYFGSYIYKRLSPTSIVLIVMTLSTLGTLISAFSYSIMSINTFCTNFVLLITRQRLHLLRSKKKCFNNELVVIASAEHVKI